MAKPVEHTYVSTAANAGWSAVKGGIAGMAVFALIGAVAATGLLFAGAALVGSFTAAGALATMGAVTGAPLAVTAILGGLGGLAEGGLIGAVGGGLIGAFKGTSRVSAEHAAYMDRVEGRQQMQELSQERLMMERQMGRQEGAQYAVNAIQQQMQQQMMQEQAAAAQHAGHVTKTNHAETIAKQREAQATTGQQATR